MLDLVEETLDEVPFAIEREVAEPLNKPVRSGRDHRNRAARRDQLNDGVAVVSLVGQHMASAKVFQQWFGLGAVGGIAGRQDEAQRIAQRIAQGMDFGRQAAARAANGLRLLIPPFAPALCWCARTMVASIMTNSKSGSSLKALKRLSQTPFSDQRL